MSEPNQSKLLRHDVRNSPVLQIKVLKILSDLQVGGVVKTMGGLVGSEIGQKIKFVVVSRSEARSALEEIKPDLVILHDPCSWKLLPQLWQIRQQCKIIIHDHTYCNGFEQSNVKQKQRFRLMLRLAYSLATRVVAVSHAQADWMRQHHLVDPEKLTVITQTTPLHELLAMPLCRWQQPRILGAYGRFSEQKGFDILLQAMQQIPDVNVKLRIGGYGEDENKLRKLAAGNRNIEFLGVLKDIPAFLDDCDGVVIPSRWEPWGNVCLEVKAAARPVIASSIDGLVEQVNDCGLLVPPGDPQALAAAIAHFCTLPDQKLQIWGENGRQNVKNAWQDYIHTWADLLLSMAQARS
jgi:glycosyltransferase involved in cell wall biosynthesis